MSNINSGQQFHQNLTHFLKADVTFADDGSTISLGWLPGNAVVINAGANVHTAFDGGTTNTADIGFRNAGDGTADDTDEFADALALGSVGRKLNTTINTAGDTKFPDGCEVVAPIISTASATAGSATVWVEYIVTNE